MRIICFYLSSLLLLFRVRRQMDLVFHITVQHTTNVINTVFFYIFKYNHLRKTSQRTVNFICKRVRNVQPWNPSTILPMLGSSLSLSVSEAQIYPTRILHQYRVAFRKFYFLRNSVLRDTNFRYKSILCASFSTVTWRLTSFTRSRINLNSLHVSYTQVSRQLIPVQFIRVTHNAL